MRLLSLACALALGLSSIAAPAATPAAASPATDVPGSEAIVSKTLANGLKIIVWPDHDIPNANFYTFYKVGSRNEYPGITGLAHYFEHMMFNGTTRRAPGAFDREMEAAGGSNNASTSNDLTIYTDWFPSSALETIFDLEGDRMANLAFDPKVVESERGVVYSERRSSVDNDNFGTLLEQMQATAFTAHPYQFPTIGWPSDIEHWKLDDLKKFFKTYYAPNNAVLVIAGDVDPAQVFALADKYLAPLQKHPEPTPITTVEPEQLGERRLVVERSDAQSPIVAYAFHTGMGAGSKDYPTLELLTTLARRLDGGLARLGGFHAQFPQAATRLHLGLRQVAGGRLAQQRGTLHAGGHLQGGVAVGLDGLHLGDAVRGGLDQGHRDGLAVLGEHAAHAGLATDDAERIFLRAHLVSPQVSLI